MKIAAYFLFRIFTWSHSSLIFLISGLRWWRKCPILVQALLTILLVILRGCVWVFVVSCCEFLYLFGMIFLLFFYNIYLAPLGEGLELVIEYVWYVNTCVECLFLNILTDSSNNDEFIIFPYKKINQSQFHFIKLPKWMSAKIWNSLYKKLNLLSL